MLLGVADSGVVRWTVDDDPRVYAFQGGAGPLVESAVDRLRADAEESDEAADPTWRLTGDEHEFGITARTGWTLLTLSTLAPLLARHVPRRTAAASAVAGDPHGGGW